MKRVKYIAMMLFALTCITSCETYGDYEIEYTPIHPMGGQYVVKITKDYGTEVTVVSAKINCFVANTADYDTDKCWVRIGSRTTAGLYGINGKLGCDVSSLTFAGTDIENLAGGVASSTETFTITDGKITLNGITAPSGTVTDKISFTYTTTKDPGAVYSVEGYRYTGWEED